MPLSLGLVISTHGSERRGRRAKRLAKLVSHQRTLLILDGMEPQQNPPGPQEGRLREPSLQALLARGWLLSIRGFCVITTRMPVTDLSDHEGSSALRRALEHLSGEAGAKLLRALGVKGDEAELRSASDEFQRPLSRSYATGQLSKPMLTMARFVFRNEGISASCSRRTTGAHTPEE